MVCLYNIYLIYLFHVHHRIVILMPLAVWYHSALFTINELDSIPVLTTHFPLIKRNQQETYLMSLPAYTMNLHLDLFGPDVTNEKWISLGEENKTC